MMTPIMQSNEMKKRENRKREAPPKSNHTKLQIVNNSDFGICHFINE